MTILFTIMVATAVAVAYLTGKIQAQKEIQRAHELRLEEDRLHAIADEATGTPLAAKLARELGIDINLGEPSELLIAEMDEFDASLKGESK